MPFERSKKGMEFKMKYGLSDEIYLKLKEIINKYSKYKFKLFGSRARGNFKKESDIDLCIEGNMTEQEKIEILNDFDLLDIPYIIDIVFYEEITKEELKKSIERDGILYE